MAKLTLSQIKARTTGHFFDRSTMKFFASDNWPSAKQRTTYKVRYDKDHDVNYVIVTDPWGTAHYHKFDEKTGDLDSVRNEDLPFYVPLK